MNTVNDATAIENSSRFLIRPIAFDDLDDFHRLARISGDGFTSLQDDRAYLEDAVALSLRSFSNPGDPAPKNFLLALEDIQSGDVVGCSAVKTGVGIKRAFWNYVLHDAEKRPVLQRDTARFLIPSDTFIGASEVGTLFLSPEHRKSGVGRHLATVRYLLIANAVQVFSEPIVAELRGAQDGDGQSPFFDAVHRARLPWPFRDCDQKIATGDDAATSMINVGEPVDIAALPETARSAIGAPHEAGAAAYHLLLREGFSNSGVVNFLDGGPIVAARHEDLPVLRKPPKPFVVGDVEGNAVTGLIANTSVSDFRAVIAPVGADAAEANGAVRISAETRDLLCLDADDIVRVWTPTVPQSSKTRAGDR